MFTQESLDEAILAQRAQVLDAAARAPVAESPAAVLDETDLLKTRSGVAAWNDFSWISRSARQTLRDAAGIAVPSREFVLWTLGVYLTVVVPFNWLLFRLLGRVEWAWAAVPVLALFGGAAVIWLTQLDIGFARAETDVTVLETQNGYPRGHVTRYTALYTALSTEYRVAFDKPPALALPFSPDGPRLPLETGARGAARGRRPPRTGRLSSFFQLDRNGPQRTVARFGRKLDLEHAGGRIATVGESNGAANSGRGRAAPPSGGRRQRRERICLAGRRGGRGDSRGEICRERALCDCLRARAVSANMPKANLGQVELAAAARLRRGFRVSRPRGGATRRLARWRTR